jgi:hypothetical protein
MNSLYSLGSFVDLRLMNSFEVNIISVVNNHGTIHMIAVVVVPNRDPEEYRLTVSYDVSVGELVFGCWLTSAIRHRGERRRLRKRKKLVGLSDLAFNLNQSSNH